MDTSAFEDIKRDYTNRFHESKGKILASDLDEFTNKVTSVIMDVLNNTVFGRDLVSDLREDNLQKNPNMTQEEWSDIKAKLIVFLFYLIMENCPQMKHEFALHTYDALRKENPA